MSISIACDQCGKQYTVADELAGKRAKCKECGNTLVIAPPQAPAASDPPPADPSAPDNADTEAPTSPVGGPTDKQMRIGAIVCLPLAILGLVLTVATCNKPDIARLLLIVFGPFAVTYSIAALIDPNLVRAVGKYGKHLSLRYKLVSSVFGIVAVIIALLLASYLFL